MADLNSTFSALINSYAGIVVIIMQIMTVKCSTPHESGKIKF